MSYRRFLIAILGLMHLSILPHGHLHASEKVTRALGGKHQSRYTKQLSTFPVKVRDLSIPYRVFGVFVMPGEQVSIRPDVGGYHPGYKLMADAGKITKRMHRGSRISWNWEAPTDVGVYALTIQSDLNEHVHLNMFVMRPANDIRHGFLGNYKVGYYPEPPIDGLAIYRQPRGYIEVDPGNRDVLISPHFTLGQFLCKQKSGLQDKAYVVLREQLILKLEKVLEGVNEQGYHATTLHVMSGYRTPSYNSGLGNVRFSRHMYGGAADIFVDERPRDGVMDDLNRDGRIDVKDAAWLHRIVEKMDGPSHRPHHLTGGLGLYRANRYHGPFIHVDVRGKRARWGVRASR